MKEQWEIPSFMNTQKPPVDYADIQAYIDAHYMPPAMPDLAYSKGSSSFKHAKHASEQSKQFSLPVYLKPSEVFDEDLGYAEEASYENLDVLVKRHHETFHEMLFRLIDETGMKDSEVYRKAWIDRKHFSKIRSGMTPRKNTVMALCLALNLDPDRSTDLLAKAGYAFSSASVTDLIVRYCIEHGICDLDSVNEILDHYRQPLLKE